jgi:translation initiation factor 1
MASEEGIQNLGTFGTSPAALLLHRARVLYSDPAMPPAPLPWSVFADPFAEAGDQSSQTQANKVHVRVQQRSGRKCITTVAGLPDDLDVKRIMKACKKNFNCNGAIVKDKETATDVIQLSGDQRTIIKQFLEDQEICGQDEVVLHGF